jgi:hypothetical protein
MGFLWGSALLAQTPTSPGEVRPGGVFVETWAGPTGFTGAGNREDGVRTGSGGAWQTGVQLHFQPLSWLSLGVQRSQGELTLNTAAHQLVKQSQSTDAVLVRIHPKEHAARRMQPWLSVGWAMTSQTLLQEQRLADGTPVYRWSNGRTYDRPEDAPLAVFEAQEVTPDYNFESRTPATTHWSVPVEGGFHLFLGRRIYASGRCGVWVGNEVRLDPRPGKSDWLMYGALGVGLRLGKAHRQPRISYPAAYLALGTDADRDGVHDFDDRCPGTPTSAPVDRRGCPVDSDGDGLPDYRDAEPYSIHKQVNALGIAVDDEQWSREWSSWGIQPPRPVRLDHRVVYASDSLTQPTQVIPVSSPRLPESDNDAMNRHQVPTPAELRLRQQVLPEGPRLGPQTETTKPIQGASFRVQLPQNAMLVKPDILTIWIDEGQFFAEKNSFEKTEFVSSRYRNESDARFFLQQVRLAGFPSAFVVGEWDGKWTDLGDVRSLIRAQELGMHTATFTQ